MTAVAIVPALAMTAIALLHGYWAFGGVWPATTERELSAMVVGAPHLSRMPPRNLTLAVALILAGIAVWPLLLPIVSDHVPKAYCVAVSAVLAVMFLLRGVLSYLPAVTRLNAVQPFTDLNRRYYAPLCLVLGGCYLALAFEGV